MLAEFVRCLAEIVDFQHLVLRAGDVVLIARLLRAGELGLRVRLQKREAVPDELVYFLFLLERGNLAGLGLDLDALLLDLEAARVFLGFRLGGFVVRDGRLQLAVLRDFHIDFGRGLARLLQLDGSLLHRGFDLFLRDRASLALQRVELTLKFEDLLLVRAFLLELLVVESL